MTARRRELTTLFGVAAGLPLVKARNEVSDASPCR